MVVITILFGSTPKQNTHSQIIKLKYPTTKKANFNRARQLISPAATRNQLNFTHANTVWTDFKNKLSEVERATIPMKSRRVNGTLNPSWMTTNIKRAINRKKINYSLMKQQATAEAGEHYHRSHRECRTLIRKSKRNYENKIASEVNPKNFFTYIITKEKSKSNVGPLANENGVLTQDSKQIAGMLNKIFAFGFTVENTSTVPTSPTLPRGSEPLEMGVIQEKEVQKCLDKLNMNKSAGPDYLTPRLLKELKQQIFQPLTSIFNRSVQLNKVHEDWRLTNVTPIFKKGDESVALNYRPISLASVAGKILEKIIRDKLVKFMENNNNTEAQHGFRNRR